MSLFDRYTTFLRETPEAGGGGGEAPTETAAPEQQATTDLSPIEQRLDQMAEQFGSIEERLGIGGDEFVNPYDPEAEESEQPGAEQIPQPDEGADPERAAAVQALRELVTDMVQEQVQPVAQQQREADIYARATQLEDEFPELQDESKARAVYQEAMELGHRLGLTEDQARDPDFIEVLYRAGMRTDIAAGETPAGEQEQGEVVLEGSGGASRAAAEEDPAASIVAAGRRQSYLTG